MGERKALTPVDLGLIVVVVAIVIVAGNMIIAASKGRISEPVRSDVIGADGRYVLSDGKDASGRLSNKNMRSEREGASPEMVRSMKLAETVRALPKGQEGRVYIGDWSQARPEVRTQIVEALDRKIAEVETSTDPKTNKALASALTLFKNMSVANFNSKPLPPGELSPSRDEDVSATHE